MKRKLFRGLCLLLSLLVALGALWGCSSRGKTLLKLEKNTISENLFTLFMSRMKGTLSSAEYFGSEALYDEFWDTRMSQDGTTYGEYYREQVLDQAKHYLAALHAFDTEGLKLPESYLDEIDEEIRRLIDTDADGSKKEFNSLLMKYGVNVKMLREAYIIEAKIAYLNEHWFGENGEKISDSLIEDYYEENYARFKHIFFYNYELLYETDEQGNDIYYREGSSRISYDTTKEAKVGEDGKVVKDANGDTVYVNEDGTVAYLKKGASRKPIYNQDGTVKTRPFTKEELIAMNDHATLIFEDEVREGNETLFDELVMEYSEEDGKNQYPGGYYVTRTSSYELPEVLEAVFEMKEGEVRMVESDYGISIVMRYGLEERGYDLEENSDFFVDTKSGQYTFLATLKSQLFNAYLADYLPLIQVKEDRLEAITMKSVNANTYY